MCCFVRCFFLSGINGAGKTTTMKMMTGDVAMSKGRAYINGYSVVKQLPMVRKEIGYCPQFDPLIGQCFLLVCVARSTGLCCPC
jgi:ABC-type multidrug transport system ATPase subunit